MNVSFSLSTSLRLIAAVSACGVTSGFAADSTLQKVPPLTVEQAPAYPENLARYHLGAEVEASPQTNPISALQLSTNAEDRNTAEAALLCDDPTVGYALNTGASSVVVSLPKIENIDSISFLNQGTKGRVTIATASAKLPADSPQWHEVSQQELAGEAVKAKVGPTEAKYVKLTFDVVEPGRIAGFGVYSTPTVSDFTMPRQRKVSTPETSESFALISYNATDLHAKARALYVSSGSDPKQANNMIDDQPASTYNFSAEDGSPVAIIDLGKATTVRRVSAVYSPRQSNVDVFVLEKLPGDTSDKTVELNLPGSEQGKRNAEIAGSPLPENAPKSLRLDDAGFAEMKPVASSSDDGRGRISVDFAPTKGRYVMLKWTPSAPTEGGFTVAEVAAFGGAAPAESQTVLAANTSTSESRTTESSMSEEAGTGTESDGKTMLDSDGKTMLDAKDLGEDAKDMPAEGPEEAEDVPAEGPAPPLPQPPPFAFVPQIVPTSP